jgi:ATP synthase subunit 6
MFSSSLLALSSLVSALEQFEVLTFFYPDLDNVLTYVFFSLVPNELFNNINLTLVLVLFFLTTFTELKIRDHYSNQLSVINTYNILSIKMCTTDVSLLNSNFLSISNSLTKSTLSLQSIFILSNIVAFVYGQILENLSYKKPVFLNYAITLFTFLLVSNILGMVPYSLTVTSYLIITLNLSGISFFSNLLIALRIYGWTFFSFFVPGGVSGPLLVLMVVIELISYVTRLFSMAIRLFANMLSGHALIKILSGLVFLSLSDLYFFGLINFVFNVVVIAVTALEVIVAGLQAYVFVILSVVYTNEAIVLH